MGAREGLEILDYVTTGLWKLKGMNWNPKSEESKLKNKTWGQTSAISKERKKFVLVINWNFLVTRKMLHNRGRL